MGGSKDLEVQWSDGFETVGEVTRSAKRRDVTKEVSSTRILDGFSHIQSDTTRESRQQRQPAAGREGRSGGNGSWLSARGSARRINLFIPMGDALVFLNLKPAA